jgi:hypothetical protein
MNCDHHDWTRQGTEGFLGRVVRQGPDAWPSGEGSRVSLDPDGCLVRRHRAIDTKPLKTRARAKRQIGSEMPCNVPLRKQNAKRWVRGKFYLLTDTMKGRVDA